MTCISALVYSRGVVTATEAPAREPIKLLPGPDSDAAGGQWGFVNSKAGFPALFGGRGAGKTVASIIKMFVYVQEHPGAQTMLTQPTYEKIKSLLLPCIRKFFGELEGSVWEWREADKQIVFPVFKDSCIFVRPAEDPSKLRGPTLAAAGMDEIAIGHQDESFMVLQGAVRQEGYPTQLWVTSTPDMARAPWLKYRWIDHQMPGEEEPLPTEDYPSFFADTADNWHNPEKYLANLQASYGQTQWAEQELHGRFVMIEGVAFPYFNERTHVREMPEGMKARRAIIGVDFGAREPTACEEFVEGEDQRLYGTWEFYQRQCTERQLVEALASRNPKKIVCDPTGKDLIEMLRRYGLPAFPARSNNFGLRFRLWGSRLYLGDDGKPGVYLSSRQPNCIAELKHLAFDTVSHGERWVPSLDNHGYDAGSYAFMEFESTLGRPKSPVSLRRVFR